MTEQPAPRWSADFDALDFEAVEIGIHPGDRRVSIRRSARPSAPLYVSLDRGTLVVSWRFEDAVGNLRHRSPNREACALYILQGTTITRNQVISGVSMLWPGEALVATEDGVRFHEVQSDDVAIPAILSNEARATDALLDLIREAAAPAVSAASSPILEVSGGLDSACVALAARPLRERFASFGLVHHGPVGIQQRERRRELVRRLSLTDFDFPPGDPAPIAGLSIAENRLTPVDDNHRPACLAALDNLPMQIDLVLTGIGGDELSMTRTYTRQEWELPGTHCPSALISVASRADMFMRRGIWVCNPLTASTVVDFCRALPDSLRQGRLLNLLMLARAGLSDGFLFPRYIEAFSHVMHQEAALFDFDAAMAQSVIGDYRLFDFSDLLNRAADAHNGTFSTKLLFELYNLLKLEAVLRTHLH